MADPDLRLRPLFLHAVLFFRPEANAETQNSTVVIHFPFFEIYASLVSLRNKWFKLPSGSLVLLPLGNAAEYK